MKDEYFQVEGLYSIGSSAVEFALKQIGRRVQLSGAPWNGENVPQVLAHRCAYLNGLKPPDSLFKLILC